jgi:hypothetical protein
LKRAPVSEHFIEHHAEAENIRAMIGRSPTHLFRRHIADSSHDGAGIGFSNGLRGIRVRWSLRLQFRESEVENLRTAVVRDHDVIGLEIAMDDAGGMRGGQSVGNLRGEVDRLPPRHRGYGSERLALHQL